MQDTERWGIVEEARRVCQKRPLPERWEYLAYDLRKRVRRLKRDEILGFAEWLLDKVARAAGNVGLAKAGHLLLARPPKQLEEVAFSTWVVSLGREGYASAAKDADTLAEVAPRDELLNPLLFEYIYVPFQEHFAATGQDINVKDRLLAIKTPRVTDSRAGVLERELPQLAALLAQKSQIETAGPSSSSKKRSVERTQRKAPHK